MDPHAELNPDDTVWQFRNERGVSPKPKLCRPRWVVYSVARRLVLVALSLERQLVLNLNLMRSIISMHRSTRKGFRRRHGRFLCPSEAQRVSRRGLGR